MRALLKSGMYSSDFYKLKIVFSTKSSEPHRLSPRIRTDPTQDDRCGAATNVAVDALGRHHFVARAGLRLQCARGSLWHSRSRVPTADRVRFVKQEGPSEQASGAL